MSKVNNTESTRKEGLGSNTEKGAKVDTNELLDDGPLTFDGVKSIILSSLRDSWASHADTPQNDLGIRVAILSKAAIDLGLGQSNPAKYNNMPGFFYLQGITYERENESFQATIIWAPKNVAATYQVIAVDFYANDINP